MLTPVEYMEAVLAELENLGMGELVAAYQPPTRATSDLINNISKEFWKAGLDPTEAAAEIFKGFLDTKNKLVPHA